MSMALGYAFGEVRTEFWSIITLNRLEGEQSFRLGSLEEINSVPGIGAGIRSGVRPSAIDIQTGEDVYLGFVHSHEVNRIDLH